MLFEGEGAAAAGGSVRLHARDARRRAARRRLAGAIALAAIGALRPLESAADPVRAQASIEVAAPPRCVWAVLAEVERWDRVFESVRSVEAEVVGPHELRLRQVTRRAGHTVRYTMAARLDPDAGRLALALDPGAPNDLALLRTEWEVRATPDGRSLVALCIESRSGLPIPRFVESRVASRSAQESVRELAAAVERTLARAQRDTGDR